MIRSSLVLAAVLLSLSPAWAGEADRDFITRAEHVLSEAYVTRNDAAVAPLLSDDYRGIFSSGGMSDKAGTLQAIRESSDESAAEIQELDIQFHGDTAIARIHEKDTGAAPDFAPEWRVITDSWVKTRGKWQLIASEELNPGAPTRPEYEPSVGEIKNLRETSNRAIAAHDMAAFLLVFADDSTFVWSNGSSARGKAELQDRLAQDFADPSFVTSVRSPESVSVSDAGVRAVEHGTWTALKREPRGETRYGGDYMAHWFKTPQGWQIRGEVYVKLRCSGPLCTP
jgi:ketosteroid isomerase-like protein